MEKEKEKTELEKAKELLAQEEAVSAKSCVEEINAVLKKYSRELVVINSLKENNYIVSQIMTKKIS